MIYIVILYPGDNCHTQLSITANNGVVFGTPTDHHRFMLAL